MTARELVARLGGARASGQDRWKAKCPAHDDREPSLSVSVGAGGRVLMHCHAGCTTDAILEAIGLEMADLFTEGAPPRERDASPAVAVPPVATWLRNVRRLVSSEIERMLARETRRGFAVVFPYRSTDGRLLYEKVRLVGSKTFWRQPAGTASVLYGIDSLDTAPPEQVVVTEGELDAHALRSVGLAPVVSVPDGSATRLTDALLAPLARFRAVLLATDSDAPGDALAGRLAVALGADRCRRVKFADGDRPLKDAGEALEAGWTQARFAAALAASTVMSAEAPDATDAADSDDNPYRIIDGMLYQIRRDRHGGQVLQRLANFSASIDEEITRDDGTESTSLFRISGRLAAGRNLSSIVVPACEYQGLGWLSRWGHGPTVLAGSGKKDHVRVAIDLMSKPTRRSVYTHTGWRKIDGEWAFLFHGGAVGANGVSVALDPPLDRLVLPDSATDVRAAMRCSLRLVGCAPPEVALPLLGAIYAAPLSLILNPDFTTWLLGATGSFKSELATLAQRHFGEFERTRLPISWCATEAAIEHVLHAAKDTLCVIDDYAPQPDVQGQREQARRAERVLRNIGNRAGRSRMRPDLTQRPVRVPRGLVVSTGEDLPPSRSIVARLVVLEVDKDGIDLDELTALQKSGHRFPHAMRGCVEWLRREMDRLHDALPGEHAETRDQLATVGKHARQAGALATLWTGLDYMLRFAVEVGAIESAAADRQRDEAREALLLLGERQARHLAGIDPAQRFVEVLREELAQGTLALADRDSAEPRSRDREIIGYRDERYAYLLPEASRRRVSDALRTAGEAWDVSTHALHAALLKHGYVIAGPDKRPETQRRFGGTRLRVLMMPIEVLLGAPATVPGSGSVPSPSTDGTGDGTTPGKPLLNRGFARPSPVSPLSPSLWPEEGVVDE